MEAPKLLTQLCGFIGMVNYQCDMWHHRDHVLAPHAAKTGAPTKGGKQAKFLWTPGMQSAFKQMKALMAMDVLCAYPNHNKPFYIYSDASNSNYQLGACIMQDSLPVAYYTKKLNNAQRNYSTVDKGLLSIVRTFREIRSLLLGAELHIHTDHSNILNIGDSSQCRFCWISYDDEYFPALHYVEGSANIVADMFLHLDWNDTLVSSVLEKKQPAAVISNSESDVEDTPLDNYFSLTYDSKMLECFACLPNEECSLNLSDDLVTDNPLDMENFKEKQDVDNVLQQHADKYTDCFLLQQIGMVDDILVNPRDPPIK